ncbi:CDP-alcohol phosphatidyltransferase [Streptomyces sp. NPDC005017]|uniref:CDP-alcohol phosphatidyltransferase n=1 Tax=Streptomyces sp. NPDC005017 TaxID=3364706 RepID=UPI0036B9F1FE
MPASIRLNHQPPTNDAAPPATDSNPPPTDTDTPSPPVTGEDAPPPPAEAENAPQKPPTPAATANPPQESPTPADTANPPQDSPTPDGPPSPPTDTANAPQDTPTPTDTPPPADGEDAPQGPPAPADESRTGGAGGKPHPAEGEAEGTADAKPRRATALVTALAAALVIGALLLPNALPAIKPIRFVRLPGEAVIGAALLLLLPRRGARTAAAVVMGLALACLTALNVLDIGFRQYLGRGFNPVLDWELLDDAQAYMQDTLGRTAIVALTAGALAGVAALFTVLVLATVRLSRALDRHRSPAALGTLIAGTVWMTTASLGLQIGNVPFASDRAAQAVSVQYRRVQATLEDEARFEKEAKADVFGATPPAQLVPGLRGKDMVFAFIESYGRSAIEDPMIAPGVNRTLDARTEALAKAGFQARSGWLTSATYGGSSWLGHSTFMSGLWIANQQRYRTVTSGDHLSLTKAFQKTGAWRTVGIMPGVQKAWPEAEYYGLDHVYDADRLGYEGPKFSWSTMPDQYALEAFQRLEHGREQDRPLMAEVILTSSHQPWAPIPRSVGWDELGDGRIFEDIEKAGKDPEGVIASSDRSKVEYGKSVQYSVTSLTEWLERYGTDDTVLVFLGDHQPVARVSGERASRDVPVTIVARDPKVLAAVDGWGWSPGLRPRSDAPVWRMSAFRDRFLTAYGSVPHPTKG